jgi:N-acetylmuramoyl-L-alanine amidase
MAVVLWREGPFMLVIKSMLLTNHNRPKKKLIKLKGIVIHWTANTNPGADAVANRNYFNTTTNWASTHYIVDDKQIIRCIPDDEIGYHVGSSNYTRLAESLRENRYTPNYFLLGIEMCVNRDGDWDKTYSSTVELAAYLLKKHGLTADNLYRHYDITGKDCPRMFIEEAAWNEFKAKVASELHKIRIMVDWKDLQLDAFMKNNSVYAPVRAVAEALGAKVEWDGSTRTVVITSKNQ